MLLPLIYLQKWECIGRYRTVSDEFNKKIEIRIFFFNPRETPCIQYIQDTRLQAYDHARAVFAEVQAPKCGFSFQNDEFL